VDSVGVNLTTGNLLGTMSVDVARPGVAVFGSFTSTSSDLIFGDLPGSALWVRKDVRAYQFDNPLGVVLIHFHNGVSTKAQLMALKSTPSVTLTLSPTKAALHQAITATVTVSNASGVPATGNVIIRHVGGGIFASGKLVNGKLVVKFTPSAAGAYAIRAAYGGDSNYLSGNSNTVNLTVA
jgi:hypothetical protein